MAKLQLGKVLVLWDFSDQSMFALRSAMENTDGDSSQIQVLHIAEPLSGPDNGALYDAAEKQMIRELCEKFRRATGEEFQNAQFQVSFGHAAQEIVRFIEKHNVRLVVIESHERKGLSRFRFGGLPEILIRAAKCPVLVVNFDSHSPSSEAPSVSHS